jgi:hypothetical protein
LPEPIRARRRFWQGAAFASGNNHLHACNIVFRLSYRFLHAVYKKRSYRCQLNAIEINSHQLNAHPQQAKIKSALAEGPVIYRRGDIDKAYKQEDHSWVVAHGNRLNALLSRRIGLLHAEVRDLAEARSVNATGERSHAKRWPQRLMF